MKIIYPKLLTKLNRGGFTPKKNIKNQVIFRVFIHIFFKGTQQIKVWKMSLHRHHQKARKENEENSSVALKQRLVEKIFNPTRDRIAVSA